MTALWPALVDAPTGSVCSDRQAFVLRTDEHTAAHLIRHLADPDQPNERTTS